MSNNIKDELQNILRGKSEVSHGTLIQTITNYIRKSKKAGTLVEDEKQNKIEETESLKKYISENQLWINNFNFDLFVSEGAEQKVFIKNSTSVYKLNDSIYYVSWVDYFNSILINNYFFPDTAYKLIGFYLETKILYALLEQNFVEANEDTDLEKVKQFLKSNGFENIRNHDYYNEEIGLILEDLHDENVLTQNGIQYFIDTVFYIKPEIFWK